MALKPATPVSVESFVWGQITLLVGSGLITPAEARAALVAIVSDDRVWQELPIALEQLSEGMPAFQASVESELALRKCGRRGPGDPGVA